MEPRLNFGVPAPRDPARWSRMLFVRTGDLVLSGGSAMVTSIAHQVARHILDRFIERGVLKLDEESLTMAGKKRQVLSHGRKVVFALRRLELPPGVLQLRPGK